MIREPPGAASTLLRAARDEDEGKRVPPDAFARLVRRHRAEVKDRQRRRLRRLLRRLFGERDSLEIEREDLLDRGALRSGKRILEPAPGVEDRHAPRAPEEDAVVEDAEREKTPAVPAVEKRRAAFCKFLRVEKDLRRARLEAEQLRFLAARVAR